MKEEYDKTTVFTGRVIALDDREATIAYPNWPYEEMGDDHWSIDIPRPRYITCLDQLIEITVKIKED